MSELDLVLIRTRRASKILAQRDRVWVPRRLIVHDRPGALLLRLPYLVAVAWIVACLGQAGRMLWPLAVR